MSASPQRRYIVTGDGITVHAETLDQAIAAFRARVRGETAASYPPVSFEEPAETSEDVRMSA
jgi:hypothetical protein